MGEQGTKGAHLGASLKCWLPNKGPTSSLPPPHPKGKGVVGVGAKAKAKHGPKKEAPGQRPQWLGGGGGEPFPAKVNVKGEGWGKQTAKHPCCDEEAA